jgi:glycosyltransferase involved in cell wall biosynthesis
LEKDIKLLIGGKGPELARLHFLREELGLQDRVFLLGWIDDETIAMLRREANLFFMPNIHIPNDVEGFGIAPLECMFAELPVVAFAVDALPESIREHGYLIPENNYQAFVSQIHKYLALPLHAKESLRAAARLYVRANYSWETAAEEYIRAFEERS